MKKSMLLILVVLGCDQPAIKTTEPQKECRRLHMPLGCPDVFVTKDGDRTIYVTEKGGICIVENGKVSPGSFPEEPPPPPSDSRVKPR